MSVAWKNLSLLHRRLAKEAGTKSSVESVFRSYNYYHLGKYPLAATLATSATTSSVPSDTRRFSSDSSLSSLSVPSSARGVPRKDNIEWKASSDETNDALEDSKWLVPRKGTGKGENHHDEYCSHDPSWSDAVAVVVVVAVVVAVVVVRNLI